MHSPAPFMSNSKKQETLNTEILTPELNWWLKLMQNELRLCEVFVCSACICCRNICVWL